MATVIVKRTHRSSVMSALRQLEAEQAKKPAKARSLPPPVKDSKGIRTPHEQRKAAAPLPTGGARELAAAVKKAAAKKKRAK